MKPIIGITSDMDEQILRLRLDYVTAIVKSGGVPVVLSTAMDDISRIADIIDGLLLSGGGDILPEYYGEGISVPLERLKFVKKQRSDFEITLLKEIVKRNKPVFAICYGMQLANVAFGGSLYQDLDMQVKDAINHKSGQHVIKIHESFCSRFDIPQSAISNPQFINSSHHQAVKKLADGFEVFAVSGDGIIEGFYKKGYPFFVCVQWHPERSLESGVLSSELKKYDKLSVEIFNSFIRKARGDKR